MRILRLGLHLQDGHVPGAVEGVELPTGIGCGETGGARSNGLAAMPVQAEDSGRRTVGQHTLQLGRVSREVAGGTAAPHAKQVSVF